jgi:GH15 family glucan-1,4-alpha-glucosidase
VPAHLGAQQSDDGYVPRTPQSEDVDPQTGALWGNFPQTYSMAGLILSAMRLSRSWEDRYWRG